MFRTMTASLAALLLCVGCGSDPDYSAEADELIGGTFVMWNVVNPEADTLPVSAFEGVQYRIDMDAMTFTVIEVDATEHIASLILLDDSEWFRGCYLNGPEHSETRAYALDIPEIDMGPMMLQTPYISGGCGGGRPFLWTGGEPLGTRTEYTLD